MPTGIAIKRKPGSRELILAAAMEAFCDAGYFAVSVEEIAAKAGVSRMTFYRQFTGKAEVASEIFRLNVEDSMPRILSILEHPKLTMPIVKDWILRLFEADRNSGQLLRVFMQANVAESDFAATAKGFLLRLILELGRGIPAFALDPDAPNDRKRWLQAWLLVYEILDQSNHAARGEGIATDPLIVDVLAERFLYFVDSVKNAPPTAPHLIYDNEIDSVRCNTN